MEAQLRHIAIAVPDVAAARAFFEEAFGMTKAGDAGRGVYMTDGVMNVALLHFGDDPVAGITEDGSEPFYGLYHFGMWVDDLEEAAARVERAGAEHVRGRRPDEPDRYYEVKYRSPDGVVFDLTTSGWVGALRFPEAQGSPDAAGSGAQGSPDAAGSGAQGSPDAAGSGAQGSPDAAGPEEPGGDG